MVPFQRNAVAACCAIMGFAAVSSLAFGQARVTPAPGEVLKVDQIMILADVTGSTGKHGVFELEKQLVGDFVAMMPDLNYRAGFSSFASGPENDWTRVRLANGTLDRMTTASRGYEYLGRSTPLRHAVETVGSEFRPNAGHAALVVFSDGKSKPHRNILDECAAIAEALDGNLCIYTVNVGSDEQGRMLLEQMAEVTGCGVAWQASDLQSQAAMEAMVREVFFGSRQQTRTVVLGAEVLFDFDKATLKPEGKRAIDALVADMKAAPRETVAVEGHTCDLGSDSYNMGLSQRRANAVKTYMVDRGINASRISTQGYGESRPAVPNTGESNRQLNRRAEFHFTSNR